MQDFPDQAMALAQEQREAIRAIVRDVTPRLIEVRRDIHRHPEVAHHEARTTSLVMARLKEAGLAPRRLPGTGLTCDLGPDGPSRLAIRADLDALPVQDRTGTPHASTVDGVAHACGHDAHVACALGAGLALAELDRRGLLPGPIRLIFQPAEEVHPSGALKVIAAGALDDVAAIIALHCDPRYEAGTIAIRPGPITSASDQVTIYAYGDGGHTSRPHLTQDLVFATGQIVVQLPAVLDRRLDPRSGANLTWGAVHAGSVHNAIPGSAVIEGTLRVLDVRAWEEASQVLADAVTHIAKPYGVRTEVRHERGVPPVDNEPGMASLVAAAGRLMLGEGGVGVAEQSLGGEDFAWYTQKIPGALVRLGTMAPGGPEYDLHQGDFDIDEAAIPVGTEVFVATAVAYASGARG
ncbi:MAG: amidohydrolase [Micrococcales bacterium]|nr:amidohydrolase [Micrococcales bacterium]